MAQISIRIDDDVKRSAEQACEDIGLSMSTAINIYLKKLGRERRIPFEVSVDPFYSADNISRLNKAADEARLGINMTEHNIEVD